jgi:hypothetical protein
MILDSSFTVVLSSQQKGLINASSVFLALARCSFLWSLGYVMVILRQAIQYPSLLSLFNLDTDQLSYS